MYHSLFPIWNTLPNECKLKYRQNCCIYFYYTREKKLEPVFHLATSNAQSENRNEKVTGRGRNRRGTVRFNPTFYLFARTIWRSGQRLLDTISGNHAFWQDTVFNCNLKTEKATRRQKQATLYKRLQVNIKSTVSVIH